MVASLSGIPKDSLVYRFITSGKPGKCELCPSVVEKLEAHHISYAPEITINLCHSCHHKTHFWPNRLNETELLKLLKKKFPEKMAQQLSKDKFLGISALAKLIAPSRNAFIRASQKLEIKRITRSQEDRRTIFLHSSQKTKSKLHHNKVNKPKKLKNSNI